MKQSLVVSLTGRTCVWQGKMPKFGRGQGRIQPIPRIGLPGRTLHSVFAPAGTEVWSSQDLGQLRRGCINHKASNGVGPRKLRLLGRHARLRRCARVFQPKFSAFKQLVIELHGLFNSCLISKIEKGFAFGPAILVHEHPDTSRP